jgi:hypothetical protein
MKQYSKPILEFVVATDVLTGPPETGFIPFSSMAPIDVKILKPANTDLYEDVQ